MCSSTESSAPLGATSRLGGSGGGWKLRRSKVVFFFKRKHITQNEGQTPTPFLRFLFLCRWQIAALQFSLSLGWLTWEGAELVPLEWPTPATRWHSSSLWSNSYFGIASYPWQQASFSCTGQKQRQLTHGMGQHSAASCSLPIRLEAERTKTRWAHLTALLVHHKHSGVKRLGKMSLKL